MKNVTTELWLLRKTPLSHVVSESRQDQSVRSHCCVCDDIPGAASLRRGLHIFGFHIHFWSVNSCSEIKKILKQHKTYILKSLSV